MFKKNTIYLVSIISIFIFFFLVGCSKTQEPKEIIIGVAWPFESHNSFFNEGVDLAVKQINNTGGIKGKELKLIKKDDKSEVTLGMSIAQSFADNKEIQAVIGHDNSFISIPTSVIYDNAGLVMLSPASTSPDLTKNGYKHIFRNIPSDDEIAKQMAIYISRLGHEQIVIYYSEDSYGSGLANSFEHQGNLRGINVVDRFNFYSSQEDLKRLNKRWQAFGVDGIFIATNLPGGGYFISDAIEAGINLPFFSGNALDSSRLPEIAGLSAEGTAVSSVFNPYSERWETENFIKDFLEEYHIMPSSYSALGYDAVKILAAAIENSDLTDRSTVAEELRSLVKWSGVTGIHEFDQRGDDVGNLVVIKKLNNGIFDYVKK